MRPSPPDAACSSLVLASLIIMPGAAPDLEAAPSFTYAVLNLLGAGSTLLGLVASPRRPANA